MLHYFVLALVLDAHTGAELARKVESGPYDTVQECTQQTVGQPAETTQEGKIVVHECTTDFQLSAVRG